MPDRKSVKAALGKWGTEVENFNQSERRKLHGQSSAAIDEGFCRGVCLDWIRRVVQGGRPSYGDPQKHTKSVAQAHDKANVVRMAAIQTTIDVHASGVAYEPMKSKQQRQEVVNAYNSLCDLLDRNLEAKTLTIPPDLMKVINKTLDRNWPTCPRERNVVDLISNALYARTALDHEGAVEANAKREQQHDQGRLVAAWDAFAKALDEGFDAQRGTDSRHKPTRRFGSIKALSGKSARQYASLTDFIATVFKDDAFQADTACLMGFVIMEPTSGGTRRTGHAIAVYRRSNGLYYFIDPNYGIYDMDRKGVVYSIAHLFASGRVYHDNEARWEVTNEADYTIFGRRGA